MNGRIQELAVQADLYAITMCDADENLDWYVTRDQKFAELIIQECLDQLLISDSTEDFDKGVAWSERQIKKHFGIE